MSAIPEEYKVRCLLGAVYAPDIGFVDGFAARSRVSKDPANLIPQTYYLQSNYASQEPSKPVVSQRLKSVLQNSGGLMPSPNPHLGAPMSTFVYGGVTPEEAHPQLNNIVGPSKSKAFEFEKGVFYQYDPTFDGGEADFGGTGRDGSDTPEYEEPNDFGPNPAFQFKGAQYPSIPAMKAPPFNVEQQKSTYNIWQHKNIDEKKTPLTYRKHVGPVYPNGYTGGRARQNVSVDGDAFVVVTSQNTVTQLERVFPIAADLAYEDDTKIYYPKVGDIEIEPKVIKARGSENSGFQIHLKHSEISKMSNPQSGDVDGGVKIEFGASEYPKDGTFIQNFQINLLAGQSPQLHYYHPLKQSWETFPLNGPSFGNGDFRLYVHYAGPNMLVGFDENVENWNAFVPLDSGAGNQEQIYARIPSNSKINMTFSNITAAFKYGPMAFNNFHPETVTSEREVDNDLGQIDHYGQIQTTMQVQSKGASSGNAKDRAKALDPEIVNAQMQAQRLYGLNAGSDPEDPDRINNWESSAASYADWRRKDSEFFYREISSTTDEETGIKTSKGRVIFDTTIEGPQFQFVRAGNNELLVDNTTTGMKNYFGLSLDGKNQPTSTALDDLVVQMPWGDISDYVESWTVEVTYPSGGGGSNDNHSYMMKTAKVILKNMKSTAIGRQILDAIEKNNLTIEVGAGDGEPSTYFQGIIIDSETENTVNGSTTTLSCVDIATQILSDVPCSTVMNFQSMRYGRIIEYAVAMSGLYDWYTQTEDTGLKRALDLRLGYSPVENSLATQILMSSPQKKVIDIIKPTLSLVIDVDALPVFYWDEETQELRLDKRQSDYLLDELTFAGYLDPDINAAYLPNSIAEGQHGVLTDKGWTTTTNNKQLHAGLVLYGQNWYGRVITYDKINEGVFSGRFTKQGLADLINSVGEDVQPEQAKGGYIGYRKIFIDKTQSNLLPDQLSLNRYGSKLESFMELPYQRIAFKCYVTRPLKSAGQFRIKTFLTPEGLSDDNAVSVTTGNYLYSQVIYSFTKSNNYIEADIRGEQLPPLAYNN